MLKGYRSIIFAALMGLSFVSFGLGAYIVGLGYLEKQARYQPYQSGNNDKSVSLASGADITNPKLKRVPCLNPKSETESDLCAQWRAAKAAEKSAQWTAIGVVASIVGIIFLLWQIMLTRKAVTDSSNATNAMLEANEIARQSSEEQLRAYLSVNATQLHFVRMGKNVDGEMIKLTLVVKTQNHGITPAYDVRAWTNFDFIESPIPCNIWEKYQEELTLSAFV